MFDLIAFDFSVFTDLQIEGLRSFFLEVVVGASHPLDAVPAGKQELREFLEGDVPIGVAVEDFLGEFAAFCHELILLHFLF